MRDLVKLHQHCPNFQYQPDCTVLLASHGDDRNQRATATAQSPFLPFASISRVGNDSFPLLNNQHRRRGESLQDTLEEKARHKILFYKQARQKYQKNDSLFLDFESSVECGRMWNLCPPKRARSEGRKGFNHVQSFIIVSGLRTQDPSPSLFCRLIDVTSWSWYL